MTESALDYKVRLEVFEGPLDLLLYLIRKEEVDVRDIPISRITEQYLQYLDLMRELNLDVAGEFILMAATLAHIKSRELLPKDPAAVSDGDEEEGDPRAELVRRLLEYQKYKEAAGALGSTPLLNRDTYPRGEANVPGRSESDFDAAPQDAPLEISLFALLGAFKRVIERIPPQQFHEVAGDVVSVAEKAKRLATRLSTTGRARFTELFEGDTRKMDVIATFLALLEMVRMKLLKITQDETGEIDIESTIPEGTDVVSVLEGTDIEKAFAYGIQGGPKPPAAAESAAPAPPKAPGDSKPRAE